MKSSDHAEKTYTLFGIRAEDIHKWIDGFFDADGFDHFLRQGPTSSYNPYDHRKFRHCKEALSEAYKEFGDKYTQEQIKQVFETHIRDDYDNYLPSRQDFENGTFTVKYHEASLQPEQEKILSKEELAEYFKGKSYAHSHKYFSFFWKGFGFRIVFPNILAMILFITSILFIMIPVFERSMMGQKKLMLKELTHSATGIINQYINLSSQKVMSEQEAKKKAAQEIQSMRYGSDMKDYFFITDKRPVMIMHPYRKDLIGKDLSDYTDREDKSGKKLFVEFVKLVEKQSEGYLEYLWQWKDDSGKAVPKLSYVSEIPQWDWIIGTGVYINDVKEEIARLQQRLYLTYGIISFGLLGLMGFIIFQSRRIENRMQQAESGLREAKDRYRALVESSNEGYLLQIESKVMYSNRFLQRMLGYSETELGQDISIMTLFSANSINEPVRKHLETLSRGNTEAGEFEAQVFTKSQKPIDIILSTSPIFFSQKRGHVISFRPITRKSYLDSGSRQQALVDYKGLSRELVGEIEKSRTLGHVVETLNTLPDLLREMIDLGTRPKTLRKTISRSYESAIERCINLSIDELGKPEVPFAFLSLGSTARHEMTMFSDQDNAMVFAASGTRDTDTERRHLLTLADRVCTKLNQAGFRYCPGGIMASNPKWCLSQEEWIRKFAAWTGRTNDEAFLEMHIIFDIRCAYGEKSLADRLQESIFTLTQSDGQFLPLYAKDCLSYKPPLGVLGKIKTETQAGVKSINLKECLRPIEMFARLYSLKHNIKESNTVLRLQKLVACGELSEETYHEMLYVFDHIWQLHFYNQIIEHTDLRKVNDVLALNQLTSLEQQNLKNVLSRISLFQSKISFDFFGTAQG